MESAERSTLNDSPNRREKGFSCGTLSRHRTLGKHAHRSELCLCCIKERETRLTQSADGGTYIQVYLDHSKKSWSPDCVFPMPVINEELQKQLKEACSKGDMDVTDRLISVGADPDFFNSDGSLRPSVYYASRYGHLTLLRRLIEKYRCNVHYKTPRGTTLLHVACLHGYEEIVTYLTQRHRLDASAKTKHGSTPLHLACIGGHPCIVQFLIENLHCDPRCTGELDETPLHTACTKGHLAIMKYLISVHGCNPSQPTRVGGETALHLACQHGHMDIVYFLIVEQKCDPNAKDLFQNTPLHSAAQQNHPEIVRYLIHEHKCDPSARNHDNCTPLHLASKYSRIEVVRVLLEEGADPAIPGGTDNSMPIQLASDHEVIKLLIRHGASPLEVHVKKVFPCMPFESDLQDTIIRTMVVGDPASGKSTLVEALKQPTPLKWNLPFIIGSRPIQVKPFTAGIVPHEIKNSEFGHTIFFDFAGQSQYYTSHAVVIDSTSITPAPIFVIVVDLSKDHGKIQLRLNFWIRFIENNKPSSISGPHIFIVGSHYDVLLKQDQRERQEKLSLVKTFAEDTIRRTSLQFQGFFPVNCQKVSTQEDLRKAIQKSCRILRNLTPNDSLCHALSVYLFALFKGRLMCTIKELSTLIQKADLSFPYSTERLCGLCECLGSKVNIMFIKNKSNLEESTIILDVNTLLSRIYAVMFAPSTKPFAQHNLDSRNGIITYTKLRKSFQDLNPRIIAECMQRLEFCHQIKDPGTLELIRGSSGSQELETVERDGGNEFPEEYYFFPCLINVEQPEGIWRRNSHSYYTGWCLQCSEQFQEFPSRIMHTILLRTAFTFAVHTDDLSASHTELRRECNLWSNGIHWFNLNGVESYLELREDGQVLVLVMRCFPGSEMECIRLRSAIINKTLETVREYSPLIRLEEGLLGPGWLQNYPLPSIKGLIVPFYRIDMVLKPLLGSNSSTFDKSTQHHVKLKDLLFWDLYLNRGNLHKQLTNPDNQDSTISDSFIFDFSQMFSKEEEWRILANIFKLEPITISNIKEEAQGRPEEICRCILHHFKRQSENLTYKELKNILEDYSLLKGRNNLYEIGFNHHRW